MRAPLASLLFLGACSAPAAHQPVSYYRDIKPLVEQKCTGCHQDGGIAPFALTDYEHLMAHQREVKIAVAERAMPPWLAAPGCSDYLDDRSLSDAQIAQLTGWIDAGLPAGHAGDYHPPAAGSVVALSRVDRSVTMPSTYTPQLSPDDYRCFVVDWPESRTRFITGFRANPGDPRIVHHVIAFLATPDQVPAFEALDASDPGPGYTCFGGAGGDGKARWIAAWAPGSLGSDFPADTGLKIEPGSKVILQVHYNTSTTAASPDQTSLDFKLDDSVGKEAVLQPFTSPAWVRDHKMAIPAGQADVVHSYAVDITPAMANITSGVLADGVPTVAWSASLHMHTHGTTARLDLIRGDGTRECMLDIPRWNFHWQGGYGFVKPKTIYPGDRISIECHWDNSAGNQPMVAGQPVPPKDMNWGEGTGDEMCLGGFYLTQ
jgi:hypothetical protein